jgi:glycosyltransferase involved in cell wall biosynthesis
MKISIVTVAFNSARTIADTLRSVAAQSHPDIEHIIIDGGSSDGTQEIVKRLARPGSTFVSEADKGIYDAMNKGVRLASGSVIGFLNSDDRFSDVDVVARIVAAMRSGDLDAVFADVAFVRGSDSTKVIRRFNSDRFNPGRLAWGWMPAHPTFYLRKEVFQNAGLFKTNYKIAGDFEFVARAMYSGKLRYCHFPEVWVEMRTGGVSTGGIRNTILLNREVARACRENSIPTNWFKLLSKYPFKLMEYVLR